MIIDVHTHAPRFEHHLPEGEANRIVNTSWNPSGARPLVYTWGEYEEAMAPVDRAICFNIAKYPADDETVSEPYLVDHRLVNDETARFVRARSEKFLGFLSVHPDDPGAIEEARRSTRSLGLVGVKLGLNYQRVHPLSENAYRIYRWTETEGLPILFHQGTSPVRFAPIDYAHPRHMDRIAMDFPNMRIIMAHIGHPFVTDALMVARKHPNVWLDLSGAVLRRWGLYSALVTALEWGVLDRIMFASDYPASTPQESMELLHGVNDAWPGGGAPRVPQDAIDGILYRDSLALLGLA